MARYREEIVGLAAPLRDPGDFDALLDRIGDARVVMLGEATHGTHEFYAWRAALTRRLIEEKGFSFVAVEGDWPDCDRVDQVVRGRPGAPDDLREALIAFDRWPTWMWSNEEVADFCGWLRQRNLTVAPAERAGFHGLDVYSLWESLRQILRYLREHDPDRMENALEAYQCFEPYDEDPQRYAIAARFVPAGCEDEVIGLLVDLRQRAAGDGAGARAFAAWQNAEVAAGAERYYRAMVAGGPRSWNVRDHHMIDTLDRLLRHYGPAAKGVVWAHNTHIGDARATTMVGLGMINIGSLARDRYGDSAVLVGFGCHRGGVIAGAFWGAPMEAMPVPPARPGSLEDELHDAAPDPALFVLPSSGRPGLLADWLPHRAIGVVYQPDRERSGNYVPSRLGARYDAFCWFDETRPVRPLGRLLLTPGVTSRN